MEITFTENVFGEIDGIDPTPLCFGYIIGRICHGHYVLNCELGQCGMKHVIENNKYVI